MENKGYRKLELVEIWQSQSAKGVNPIDSIGRSIGRTVNVIRVSTWIAMFGSNVVSVFYYEFPRERLVNIYQTMQRIIDERYTVGLGRKAFRVEPHLFR